MIEMQFQDSIERQFLSETPMQYIVQLMKHRDNETVEAWEFDRSYEKPAPRRRIAGVATPRDWTPNYARRVNRQVRATPIPAAETQRRIYAAGNSSSDFWSRLKKINGKDFQLFWCVEDYRDREYRGIDAHAALFIAGLHTQKLNQKYSTDEKLRERFCDDYGVRNLIAQCVREAGLSVKHSVINYALHPNKYSSQIHSVNELRARNKYKHFTIDGIKTFYLTKSVNDASGSMCFGSNRKLEKKYVEFLHRGNNE